MAEAEITSERIGDGLYVLFGVGGNMVASIGEQGVLIVDDQFPEMVPKYRAAIRELGGGDVDFAVNTHWHYDHADGNKQLGPDGTWLISQANSRQMMMVDNVVDTVTRAPFTQAAYAADALPVATFDRRMQLHFNGERIDLLHFGPAHTTGDAAVIFRSRNTVHLGDVFNGAGYPFIDRDIGGDLDVMIEFCVGVLAELEPGATVIPGHGAVAEYADLEAYISMLTGVRDNIAALIDEGATLEQVIAANPTAEWDERYGNSAGIVNRAFMTLSR
jgi:glyoxylase-like metal-dependent hydrolase (beta-lactamase superfamily II)